MASIVPSRFFVYGTLMRGQENFAACAADALTITPATIRGEVYHLTAGFPVLRDTGHDVVLGQIMTFASPGRTLETFDELEGFDAAHPEAGLYVRVVREARPLNGGRPADCWVYVVPPDRFSRVQPYATRVPGGDWAGFRRKATAQ